jgi:hypothetical protein
MAVGNGYVNEKLNIDTSVRFAYGHGIIDEKIWNTLELTCCRGCIDGCDLTTMSGQCGNMVEEIFEFLWFGGLNPYDLYRKCDPNPGLNSIKMDTIKLGLIPDFYKDRYANSSRKHPFFRVRCSQFNLFNSYLANKSATRIWSFCSVSERYRCNNLHE